MSKQSLTGAGLGLRRDIIADLDQPDLPIDFMEVAPENWINIGGKLGKQFARITEQYPFVFHGLSLSIGGPAPIDESLVRSVKELMQRHSVSVYSEHLTYCSDDGHLYDLMPIPFTQQAVEHVVRRIDQVQNILGRPIALENASYYAAPNQEMSEIEFINQVVTRSGCQLLLDVNNIYVNSINHSYDPLEFLSALPGDKVTYGHIAGHFDEADDLKVDTHGADVIDPVWHLLSEAYRLFGIFPTLLERDFNFPPLNELLNEVDQIRQIQSKFMSVEQSANG
jgi:uncharacterized protein (UPF0276 family)